MTPGVSREFSDSSIQVHHPTIDYQSKGSDYDMPELFKQSSMGQKSTLAIQRKLKGVENKTHSRAPTKSRTYNMSFDVSEVVVHTDHLG